MATTSRKKEAFDYFDESPNANAKDALRDIGLSNSTFYNYRKQWKTRRKEHSEALITDDPDPQDRRQHSMIELIDYAKTFVRTCGDPNTAQEALEAYFAAIE